MHIPEPPMKFTYPKEVRFACSRCGMCCTDTEAKARTILMLRAEAESISKETSMDLEEFVERIENFEPYVYQMRKTSNKKCMFLKYNLCSIYRIRPLICRFFPFQLRNLGRSKYIFSVTNECPNVGEGPRLERRFFERLFAKFLESMQYEEGLISPAE